jgi:hypothetical protein
MFTGLGELFLRRFTMNQNYWTKDEQNTWLRGWTAVRETVRTVVSHVLHPIGHTCLKCGFLALGDGEMIPHSRGFLSVGLSPFLTKASAATLPQSALPVTIEQAQPNCFKSLWVRDPERFGYGIVEEVTVRRRPCEGFFRYRPGYSPLEHRTLQEKKHERLEKIILIILSALAGAALTLLTGWLKKYAGF